MSINLDIKLKRADKIYHENVFPNNTLTEKRINM